MVGGERGSCPKCGCNYIIDRSKEREKQGEAQIGCFLTCVAALAIIVTIMMIVGGGCQEIIEEEFGSLTRLNAFL